MGETPLKPPPSRSVATRRARAATSAVPFATALTGRATRDGGVPRPVALLSLAAERAKGCGARVVGLERFVQHAGAATGALPARAPLTVEARAVGRHAVEVRLLAELGGAGRALVASGRAITADAPADGGAVELAPRPLHVGAPLRAPVRPGPDADTLRPLGADGERLCYVPWVAADGLVARARAGANPFEAATAAAVVDAWLRDGQRRHVAAFDHARRGWLGPGDHVLTVRVHRRPTAEADAGSVRADVEVVDETGRLALAIRGLSLVPSAGASPAPPRPADPQRGAATKVRRLTPEEATAQLRHEGVIAGGQGLVAAVAALAEPSERETFEALWDEGQRAAWWAARVAARTLARDVLRDLHGLNLPLTALAVVDGAGRVDGAPALVVREPFDHADKAEIVASLPSVTLADTPGLGVAAVTLPGAEWAVGVDVDRVQAWEPGVAARAFDAAERALPVRLADVEATESERLTALWTLKEATAKALGLSAGAGAGSEVIVAEVSGDGRADVALADDAAEAFEQLGGMRLNARVRLDRHVAVAEGVVELGGPRSRRANHARGLRAAADVPPLAAETRRRAALALAALLRAKGIGPQPTTRPTGRGAAPAPAVGPERT